MKINPFAYHLWQRFWAIASPYWRGEERLKAWGLLALLVVLLLGQTRFAVMLNEQTGEFTSALAARVLNTAAHSRDSSIRPSQR